MAHVANSVDEMLHLALNDTIKMGARVSPRGNPTRDFGLWVCTLTNPRARLLKNPVRDIRVGYAAAKLVWDLCERDDPQPLLFWNPSGAWYIDEVDGKQIFWGESYGKRFMPYLREHLLMLKDDPASRRAWTPIWSTKDVIHEPPGDVGGYRNPSRSFKNVPCCLGFNLRIVSRAKANSDLDMQVVMRSQSVGVLPYDVFLLSAVHELIANTLELRLGRLEWVALSMHVYEREIVQRKAELDWYTTSRFHSSSFSAEHVRAMAAPMEPLSKGILTAGAPWWEFMEDVIAGEDRASSDNDPIEKLLIAGLPRDSGK